MLGWEIAPILFGNTAIAAPHGRISVLSNVQAWTGPNRKKIFPFKIKLVHVSK
jgi:hypothetical protein